MDAWNGTFELVEIAKIIVDHRYQRSENPALIANISADPNWAAFGAISCYKRGALYYCTDGQQRLAGVKSSEKPPKAVPVVSFPQAQLEQEAATFVQINVNRKAVGALEKHKAQVVANDPAALVIEAVVETAGYTIGAKPNARTISAISSLYAVYNQLGEMGLLQVLVLCRDAWPGDTNALTVNMLRALADIVGEKMGSDSYSRPKLTTSLQKTSPILVMRKADELRFDLGGSKQRNMRRAFNELVKV